MELFKDMEECVEATKKGFDLPTDPKSVIRMELLMLWTFLAPFILSEIAFFITLSLSTDSNPPIGYLDLIYHFGDVGGDRDVTLFIPLIFMFFLYKNIENIFLYRINFKNTSLFNSENGVACFILSSVQTLAVTIIISALVKKFDFIFADFFAYIIPTVLTLTIIIFFICKFGSYPLLTYSVSDKRFLYVENFYSMLWFIVAVLFFLTLIPIGFYFLPLNFKGELIKTLSLFFFTFTHYHLNLCKMKSFYHLQCN